MFNGLWENCGRFACPEVGGDLRSVRVLGRETGTIMWETCGQFACSVRRPARSWGRPAVGLRARSGDRYNHVEDLRLGYVLGQETDTIM